MELAAAAATVVKKFPILSMNWAEQRLPPTEPIVVLFLLSAHAMISFDCYTKDVDTLPVAIGYNQ